MYHTNYSPEVKRLKSINVVVTNRCNAGCLFCGYHRAIRERIVQPYNLKLSSITDFILLLRDSYNLQHVCITGGEPLLYPNLEELLNFIKKHDMTVSISTNGTIVKRLKKIANLIDVVVFSLHGARAETHFQLTGLQNFNELLSLPKILRKINPDLGIGYGITLTRINYRELPDIVPLAKHSDVDALSVLPVMFRVGQFGHIIPLSKYDFEKLVPAAEEIEEVSFYINKFIDMSRDLSVYVIQAYEVLLDYVEYFKYFRGLPYKYKTRDRPCSALFSTLTLDFDGYVKPCFDIPIKVPISEIIKEGINHPLFVRLRHEHLSKGCIFKKFCLHCFNSRWV